VGSYQSVKRNSSWSVRRSGVILLSALAVGVLFSFPSLARSADDLDGRQLVTFDPWPASPLTPELIFDGTYLCEGAGAVGNGIGTDGPGDGGKSLDAQFGYGLKITTPFVMSSLIPGSIINLLTNSTSFYDATLDISGRGLQAIGAPARFDPFDPAFRQKFGSAPFRILSTDPVESGPDDPVLLLSGTINSASLYGELNSGTGGIISADVTYSGGAILAAAGATSLTGELSWSLLNATPKFRLTSGGYLDLFQANAAGQFSAHDAPEPGALVMLFAAVVGLGGYVWRKRRNW
jgi:hypothetical protein